jgi:hypothetical protein
MKMMAATRATGNWEQLRVAAPSGQRQLLISGRSSTRGIETPRILERVLGAPAKRHNS